MKSLKLRLLSSQEKHKKNAQTQARRSIQSNDASVTHRCNSFSVNLTILPQQHKPHSAEWKDNRVFENLK
jgi:hypothetical protein